MPITIITTEKLKKEIGKCSDRNLVVLETRITTRIANIDRCMDWPALSQALAKDLEIIWAEQTRRHIAKHKKDMEDAVILVDKLSNQAHNHGR
jgi:hypothetical protein